MTEFEKWFEFAKKSFDIDKLEVFLKAAWEEAEGRTAKTILAWLSDLSNVNCINEYEIGKIESAIKNKFLEVKE